MLISSFTGALLAVLFAWGIRIFIYKFIVKGNSTLESLPLP
jgi:hypothetical protein